MKSFEGHQRLLIFLLLALALTCAVSPWLALGADWAHARWPGILDERIPFSRVFNRAFMISGFVLFFLFRRSLADWDLKALFAADRRTAGGDFLTGMGLAVGSMAALLVVMAAADIYSFFFRLSFERSVSRVFSAFMSGIFAGTLEEVFFRGILFKGLLHKGSAVRAYLLANLFYSAIHFVKPGERYYLDGLEPLAGFKHLLLTFAPFLEPLELLPGLFGLFLLGVVLSFALARTGKLYLAIGLHAGWILSLKTMRVFGNYSRKDLGWVFGVIEPKIVSGAAAWIGILAVGAVVYFLTRNRQRLSGGPLPARAA
jgi:membrane protease YdiL (CAAX protease family)